MKMAFQEVEVKSRIKKGEGTTTKMPHVTMTDGKKFVFNLAAANLVGNVEGLNAAMLYDAESGSVGFRFREEAPCEVIIGTKTLTIKGNITNVLPDTLKAGKWQAPITWNKEAQLFEIHSDEWLTALKRGEKEAAKLAVMAPEKRAEYLAKKAARQAAEKAKRAAA